MESDGFLPNIRNGHSSQQEATSSASLANIYGNDTSTPHHLPPVPKSPSLTASTILNETDTGMPADKDAFFMRVADKLEQGTSGPSGSITNNKPGTPLTVQSLSSSVRPSNPSTPSRPMRPADSSLVEGSTSMAPQDGLKSEGGKRIRGEIQQLAKELKLLEELDEREKELQKDREKRAMEDRRRREREEEYRRMKEEIELRKFQEEQKLQRQKRDEEATKKRAKEKKEAEHRDQQIAWEIQQNRRDPVQVAHEKEQEGRDSVKRNQDKEVQAVAVSHQNLKTDLQRLYEELDELQDRDYLNKQRVRAQQEALRDIQQDHDALESTHLEAQYQRMKQKEMQSEISSLRDELRKLERQDFISQQKKKAKDEHEAMLKQNESERVIAQREMEKKRAAERFEQQRLREQQIEAQRAAQEQEDAMERLLRQQQQPVRPLAVAAATKGDSSVSQLGYRPDSHVRRDHEVRKINAQRPVEAAVIQPKPVSTFTTAPPLEQRPPSNSNSATRSKRWITKDEASKLEADDIHWQRRKQQEDLKQLKKEHADLIGEEYSDNSTAFDDVNKTLAEEASIIKCRWEERDRNMQTAVAHQPSVLKQMLAQSNPIPGGVQLYTPQGINAAQPQPHVNSTNSSNPYIKNPYNNLQEDQSTSVRQMEEKYVREKVKAEDTFKKAESLKEQRRQYWREKERNLQKVQADRERISLQCAADDLKSEVVSLQSTLKMLEAEDELAEQKKVEAAAERERMMRLQLERAKQLQDAQVELHQDVEKRQREEIAILQQQLRQQRVNEILSRVDEAKRIRGEDAARWNKFDETPWRSDEGSNKQNKAAEKIQESWKRHTARERVQKLQEMRIDKMKMELEWEERHEASLTIQAAMRRMHDRKVATVVKQAREQQKRKQQEDIAVASIAHPQSQQALGSSAPPVYQPTPTVSNQHKEGDTSSTEQLNPTTAAEDRTNSYSPVYNYATQEAAMTAGAITLQQQQQQIANIHELIRQSDREIDINTQLKIRNLEDQIAALQSTLAIEREQTAELEVKELELLHLKHEKEYQQKQINTLNDLLLSHANIINQLQLQVVSLSPSVGADDDITSPTQMTSHMYKTDSPDKGSPSQQQQGWKGSSGGTTTTAPRDRDKQSKLVIQDDAAVIIQSFFKMGQAKNTAERKQHQREEAKKQRQLYSGNEQEERREATVDEFYSVSPLKGSGAERRDFDYTSDVVASTEDPKKLLIGEEEYAAWQKQPPERMRTTSSEKRKRTMREKYSHIIEDEATLVIQTNWRASRAKSLVKQKRKERDTVMDAAKRDEAAVRIQCAWRKEKACHEANGRRENKYK